MARREWSLQEAKNGFSAVVAAAVSGTPQIVTKRGKPAVVVLSITAFEQLSGRARRGERNLVDHLLAMPKDDGAFERIDLAPRDFEL